MSGGVLGTMDLLLKMKYETKTLDLSDQLGHNILTNSEFSGEKLGAAAELEGRRRRVTAARKGIGVRGLVALALFCSFRASPGHGKGRCKDLPARLKSECCVTATSLH